MSILDDTPLDIGTQYYGKTIIGWDAEAQKYLVACEGKKDLWLSRERVESEHGSSLMEGVEFRESKPGNSYNTRYFRVRAD